MAGLLFITDLHITTTCSSRVDDPLSTIVRKLEWCLSFCESRGIPLVLGGDVFDTPTVSFEAYNAVYAVLKRFSHGVYAVWGNHDMLYRSRENVRKCSLYALIQSGVVRELHAGEDVVFGGLFRLTCRLPLQTCSIPQVLVYHGFLNQRDGDFTVDVTDLVGCESLSLVLLGHDHTKYDDLQLSSNVIVVRPGSFYRNRRDESCRRQVYGVWVDAGVSGIRHTLVEVPAGTPDEVFASKSSDSLVAVDVVDYDALLTSLRESTGSEDMTFVEALSSVAPKEVVSYCEGLVSSVNVIKQK